MSELTARELIQFWQDRNKGWDYQITRDYGYYGIWGGHWGCQRYIGVTRRGKPIPLWEVALWDRGDVPETYYLRDFVEASDVMSRWLYQGLIP